MMRSAITRTLAVSEITAHALTMKDGVPTVENLHIVNVPGKVSEKEAIKIIRNQYGKDFSVTIGNITTTEDTYEISVEDFMKYARKVSKESEATAPEEN
ncbi:hypothetical protein IJZ97_04580 [bacterium]|nr:hypothetical protein [bacterium]